MAPSVLLEIPPKSVYVGVVRLAVASLARSSGVDEARVEDLKIAVSEACSNAVLAHEAKESDSPVTISWTEEGGSLVVEVADRGQTYDTRDGEPAADSQGFDSRMVMSMALLGSLVDDYEIGVRDGGGMAARLMIQL